MQRRPAYLQGVAGGPSPWPPGCAALCCAVHLAVLCCAQELGRSSLPVVRNNILVALSDMLIQYTALVDAHMPRLAACMR